ncbi:MAG: RNA-directed DNA polymerase [Chloroflexi bacterium]|nr:RNA-directed DNA polymerase [Chloroflexota bacterium]
MLRDILPAPIVDLLTQSLGVSLRRPRGFSPPAGDTWIIYHFFRYTLAMRDEDARAFLAGGKPPKGFTYRHFTVPKKDGSDRQLVEPGYALKAVQRRILRLLEARGVTNPAALAFRKGRSIADHAWTHAGAAIIITADIEDFFLSTSHRRVREVFHSIGYVDDRAHYLTRLTTYRGSLPQGAPTSPILSNLVNAEMDKQIARRTSESGGRYTRYADDMAFSWPDRFRPPGDFEQTIRGILREHGYRLHPRKGWRVWLRRDEPELTGLILTRRGGVDIPDSMKVIMRELEKGQSEDQAQRLSGYEGFRHMVQATRRRYRA